MKNGTAKIIYGNNNAGAIISSAGRISTTIGTADELYFKSCDNDKIVNNNLIEKILLSGHYSVLEHLFFNLSFDNVSVFVEQFMIEYRLASFTVKSRRYVNFGNMGYYEPEFVENDTENEPKMSTIYQEHIDYLFREYNNLLEAGVPKEDARFVLPYCFRSNFYCSVNAREFIHIVSEMLYGRGAKYSEVKLLGGMLLEQCREEYPYLCKQIEKSYNHVFETDSLQKYLKNDSVRNKAKDKISILYSTSDSCKRVCEAYAFNHNILNLDIDNPECQKEIFKNVIKQSRKRELEQVSYSFRINRISLAGITHLVRHRMQSAIIPEFVDVCNYAEYVVPQSIVDAGMEQQYHEIFDKTAKVYDTLCKMGMSRYDSVYLFLSGMEIAVITTMNANELLLFLRLRTCSRAQWEIKECADELLELLREESPVLFSHYGPSCVINGVCPEGKMSCGKIKEMHEKYKGEVVY